MDTKKRIGILTFPYSSSFGATLQMYALYRTVTALGCEAELINYHNAYMKECRHTAAFHKQPRLKQWLHRGAQWLLHRRQRSKFREFEKEMARYPATVIETPETLSTVTERYECVICGSDQVWNPDITGRDLSYFLNFCDSTTRRISYAPSFGVETLPEDFAEVVAEECRRFSHLSVREAQGQALVEKLTGHTPPLVVDPTLLMTREEWAGEETPHPAVKGEYILYYTVRHSDSLFRFCLELAQKSGLKVLIAGGNAVRRLCNRDDRVEYVCDLGPREWLYLLHRARYVVTNSFHGTVFSINYRKDFYVEFSSLTNSRLSHIVSTLGLEKQIVTAEEVELCPTDYTRAERLLPQLRNESLRFLQNAVEDDR